jgi:UDP-N-acetylglucosamine diphosphorylase/glucosamine-1-phosphate N-acetyltransferase
MNAILFDDDTRDNFLPLTATKALSDLRLGIFNLREKWEKYLHLPFAVRTSDYLQEKYGPAPEGFYLAVNSSVLPSIVLREKIKALLPEQGLRCGECIVAFKSKQAIDNVLNCEILIDFIELETVERIEHLWDLFLKNGAQIKSDLAVQHGKKASAQELASCFVCGGDAVYFGEGVQLQGVFLNCTEGPIYIDDRATVMEGAMLRGPIYIGKDSTVKMGAKIYGGSTIGEKCTVGGEIKNSIFNDCSNKGHDGYLGNSVLGSFCNLGADTNASNMKNTLGEIKVWNMKSGEKQGSGQNFCGVFMGDYCRTAISTRLTCGTLVGVACHIFEHNPVPVFLPSFSYGVNAQMKMDQLHLANSRFAALKGEKYGTSEKNILNHLYEKKT